MQPVYQLGNFKTGEGLGQRITEMKQILTDKEIDTIEMDCWASLDTDNPITFARAIEQAILDKIGKLTIKI